jgi:hypothetical protein
MELTATQLNESDPKRFDREYGKWCENALDYDWYEPVYDQFIEGGEGKGFRVAKIYFSGFYSQGDGASWEGVVYLDEFMRTHCDMSDPRWHIVHALVDAEVLPPNVDVYRSVGSSRYYHEQTMQVGDIEAWWHDEDYCVPKGVYAGANANELYISAGGDPTLEELHDMIESEVKDYARDIYKALEKEHDYLLSEESFIEHCGCNDITFETEDDDDN